MKNSHQSITNSITSKKFIPPAYYTQTMIDRKLILPFRYHENFEQIT